MANQNVNLQSQLLEKLNVFSKLSVKLVFLTLLTVLYLFVPISSANAQATSDDPAYPVCYFEYQGNRVWEWGLKTPDAGNWTQLDGKWERNKDTGVWKFRTTTNRVDVARSCNNAKIVSRREGWITVETYAAVSKKGKNYEIVYAS